MAVLPIRLLGDEVLRRPAALVDTFGEELAALANDLFETMYAAEGAGLAAPQVGIPLRLFVFDVREITKDPTARMALINPEVIERSQRKDRDIEGCLSIPGVEETVERASSVVMRGFDPAGSVVEIGGEGLLSRVLQHELDHLDGVLFIDRLTPLKRRLLLQKYRKLLDEQEGS